MSFYPCVEAFTMLEFALRKKQKSYLTYRPYKRAYFVLFLFT